jgi:RimJ/RimL family protein N-acetyltransferase
MAASKTTRAERVRDTYLVQRLREPEEIRRLLEPHRRYAAYGLAQLEPPLFKQSQWWLAEGDGGHALLMHSHGGLGHALLTLGDEIGLYVLLGLHPGPAYSFATIELEHLPVMRPFFSFSQTQPVQRMIVDRRAFVPAPLLRADASLHLRRLSAADTPDVNRLNASEGIGIRYRRDQIRDGTYFGIFSDGLLVAMAGTHGISEADRIAVLGNVFTHPRYRNSHLALQTTSAVTSELLETCDEVVLTVDPRNEPAVKAYSRLGYREDFRLIETAVTRRESLGAVSLARRLVARWRGRNYGRELVYSPARRG